MAQLNGKQQHDKHQKYGLPGSHSRSSSQPLFFSNNCLPPLSPLPHSESSLASSASVKDVSMEEVDVSSKAPPLTASSSSSSTYAYENSFRGNFESLPPRKGHRRSNSDIPLGFSAMIQTSPQLVPISGQGIFSSSTSVNNINKFGFNESVCLQKQETDAISVSKSNLDSRGDRRSEGEVVDDLFRTYLNLENASSSKDKNKGKIVSTTKRSGGYGFKIEGESTPNGNGDTIEEMCPREGVKRSAVGDIAPASRHFRSLSVDSAFGNLNFGEESTKLPPSGGNHLVGQFSPRNPVHENLSKFSLEFGNGEFNDAEVKKIMTDERLAEIALSDPKRAKRILANRQSAARSKERKLRYISELEHKVQTLQTEATTLSAQLTILQKDFTDLTNQNNELKFRLKAMERQAQLRDALHEALTVEVQRLKVSASAELNEEGGGGASSCLIQQISPMKKHLQMLQIQHHHSPQQQYSVPNSKNTTTASATPSA